MSGIMDYDPFEGLVAENQETKYYRVEDTVFAEPLESTKMNETTLEDDEEITFVENVTVQKTPGKKTKYHMNVDPSNPVCPQPDCDRTFANTTLLKAHIRKVHCADRQRFQCSMCPNTYPAKYLLHRHTAVHEKRKMQCPICSCFLSERTNMAEHVRSHTRDRAHSCAYCGASFGRASSRLRHTATCRARPATAAAAE